MFSLFCNKLLAVQQLTSRNFAFSLLSFFSPVSSLSRVSSFFHAPFFSRIFSCILISCFLLISSCKKTSTAVNPPPVAKSNLPILVTEYIPHSQRILTGLTYGSGGWPATISIHTYDTTGGIGYRDTALIRFQLTDSLTPPGSYDISWVIGTAPPDFGAIEHHLLYYDNNHRIVKDSTASTTGLDLASSKFIYNGSQIIVQKFDVSPQFPEFYSPYEQDTLGVVAGNIFRFIGYYLGGSSPAFTERDVYTASTYPNPLYQTRVSNSLGAMLRLTSFGYGYIGDFLSANLMSQWGYTPVENQAFTTLNYSWSTDAKGRVPMGSGTDIGGGGPGDIFTYQYP